MLNKSNLFALTLALPLMVTGSAFAEPADTPVKDDTKEAKEKTPKCFFGKVWDKTEEKCIKEEKSSSLDQDSLYEYGRDLAMFGQYDNALRVLYLAPNQSDPRVQTMLGFSHRKNGDFDKALVYYQAAIDQDPNLPQVREYLGEAYLELGQLEDARTQLSEIERICGNTNCGEYTKLASLMVDAQRQ